eukprot:TRINITY_DN34993_c0_g1_i1.p2 TRINITY_DN34993_c0_g1~~TRINITY_DN34993_c0_g1_i1.p2  ORF type:complete len:104 (-),score=3.19 TRINITY_DN34993_c0_g1_i1:301-612(-)
MRKNDSEQKLYFSFVSQMYFTWDRMFWPCGFKLFTLYFLQLPHLALDDLKMTKIQTMVQNAENTMNPPSGVRRQTIIPIEVLKNNSPRYSLSLCHLSHLTRHR